MRHSALKIAAWPEADRALWTRITAEGCPLDDQGAGAHWAAETKRSSLAIMAIGFHLS